MIFQNIALLRRRAGLSQEAVAERLGVTRQTVAKWENGESVPDVLHADRLAEHGYKIQKAGMIDMFPATGHFESVSLFRRSA